MTFPAVLRRELRSLVMLPQTWAIAAAFAVISGIFFVNLLVTTSAPDLARYYDNIASTLIVLVPIVAMRSFAEERRSGALDLTLSWPVSRPGLVGAVFVANTAYVWALSCVALLYYRILTGLAAVDGGRVVGGFVGLLLLSAAFGALALAVSARAATPAAAAFLGFGLLLFLWILDFAPGWIGHTLRTLGPSAHFEAFPRGVISAGDVAYFVTVTLVGLGLAVAGLGRGGRRSATALRRRAAMAAVAALWVAGSGVAGAVDGQADLTPTKRFTLTDASRAVVDRLRHQPVRITGFVEPLSRESADLTVLVQQYRAAGVDIHLDLVDPDARPGRAKEAGISGYGQYLVAVGDRHELGDDINQIALTSTILRLSRSDPPRACFTVGHGERSVDDETDAGLSRFGGALARIAYDVVPLTIGAPGGADALARCAVVVVAGPRVPLLPGELGLLGDFARRNGRLVVLSDGDAAGVARQLNELLRPWGVALATGVVRDVSALADDAASVVSSDYPSKSPAVSRLQEHGIPVVLVRPQAVERAVGIADDGWLSPLVRSSRASWLDGPDGRRKGPFVLGAVVDWSRVVTGGQVMPPRIVTGGQVMPPSAVDPTIARTRIGVVGAADVFSNRYADVLGNGELGTGLVQWVARDDDVISAGRAPGGQAKIVLTGAQKADVTRRGIVAPALALLLPVPVTLVRLRRG